jgi:hypothetical protein
LLILPEIFDTSCGMLRFYIFLSLIAILFWSCTTTETIQPNPQPWIIKTQLLTKLAGYKANSGGIVITRGTDPALSKGVCWSRSKQLPTISLGNEFVTNEGTSAGDWSSTIVGLTPKDSIWVRAYVMTRNGTFYGQLEKYLVPLETTIPAVVTKPVTDARKTSAALSGRISTDGGANLVERGFLLYNTATQVQQFISMPIPNPDSLNDDFDTLVTGLSTNTTYEVKAYARNKDYPSRQFGEPMFFFTDQSKPDAFPVVLSKDSVLMDSSAFVSGLVQSPGDFDVISKGICYGTSRNPAFSGPRVDDPGFAGLPTIQVELKGLVPGIRYYYRAYARNQAGVGYGQEKSFVLSP